MKRGSNKRSSRKPAEKPLTSAEIRRNIKRDEEREELNLHKVFAMKALQELSAEAWRIYSGCSAVMEAIAGITDVNEFEEKLRLLCDEKFRNGYTHIEVH